MSPPQPAPPARGLPARTATTGRSAARPARETVWDRIPPHRQDETRRLRLQGLRRSRAPERIASSGGFGDGAGLQGIRAGRIGVKAVFDPDRCPVLLDLGCRPGCRGARLASGRLRALFRLRRRCPVNRTDRHVQQPVEGGVVFRASLSALRRIAGCGFRSRFGQGHSELPGFIGFRRRRLLLPYLLPQRLCVLGQPEVLLKLPGRGKSRRATLLLLDDQLADDQLLYVIVCAGAADANDLRLGNRLLDGDRRKRSQKRRRHLHGQELLDNRGVLVFDLEHVAVVLSDLQGAAALLVFVNELEQGLADDLHVDIDQPGNCGRVDRLVGQKEDGFDFCFDTHDGKAFAVWDLLRLPAALPAPSAVWGWLSLCTKDHKIPAARGIFYRRWTGKEPPERRRPSRRRRPAAVSTRARASDRCC